MKRFTFILGLVLLTAQAYKAQDFHFSQFDANPFFINPALTGERLSDYKGIQINANYRNQMAEFTSGNGAYKSLALGVDLPINSRLSTGQYVYNDNSATGAFKTTGLMLSGAYNLIDQGSERSQDQNLSVGLQLGVFNMSTHPENFTYASQYSSKSPDGFNRNLPTGEAYAQQSDYNFNMNFGIYYRARNKSKKLTVFSGFSVYNISKTNESFLGLYSPAAIRFNLHGGVQYKADEQLTIVPQFLYMNQASANQLNVSILFYSRIPNSSYEPLFGIGLRNKDAVIFQLGLKSKNLTFRVSYDALTNYTKIYKNRGVEFSVMYTLSKLKKGNQTEKVIAPTDTDTNP